VGGGIGCKDRAMLANEFDGVPARTGTLALRKYFASSASSVKLGVCDGIK